MPLISREKATQLLGTMLGGYNIAPLVDLSGLGERIYPVPGVIDAALPPEEYRAANHYFRIDATRGEGFYLVVDNATIAGNNAVACSQAGSGSWPGYRLV